MLLCLGAADLGAFLSFLCGLGRAALSPLFFSEAGLLNYQHICAWLSDETRLLNNCILRLIRPSSSLELAILQVSVDVEHVGEVANFNLAHATALLLFKSGG